MFSSLEIAIVMLAASVGAVAMLRRFNLPALLGYLIVGAVLAPTMNAISGDFNEQSRSFNAIAHFGVVFLMFSVGLEFNLSKLNSMKRYVFGLGGAQVGASVFVGLLVLLLPTAFVVTLFLAPLDWKAGLVLAAALAMSSTALIAKLLSEQRELESEHGQRVMGVLLFQDLAVIPMLVLLPTLAGQQGDWRWALGLAFIKAVLILVLLFKFGRNAIRRWFATVARRKSHELFTLNVLLVILVAGWVTYRAGLSMELGAFVAGMLIAETEYRYQVEEDIKPFRDVLLGLFFISLGMRLDWMIVFGQWWVVLLLVVIPMCFKFLLVYALARLQKASLSVAARTALYLAQAGEFGLVLLTQAFDAKLLAEPTMQVVLAAMLISLLVSALLLANSDRLLMRFSNQEWLARSVQLQAVARRGLMRNKHVIICGYGRSGQSIAHVLEAEGVSYVALDLDPDRVMTATAAGEPVVYGDASRRETLVAAGIHRAATLVVSVDDTVLSRKILQVTRELAPQIPVVVRTSDHTDIETLRQAGATEVVPEVIEGSLLLASHALVLAGVPLNKMQQRVSGVRNDRYSLLSSYFHGADDHDDSIEGLSLHIQTVRISKGSSALGQTLEQLSLNSLKVMAILRGGQRIAQPDSETLIQIDDVLVLAGELSALADAANDLQRSVSQ
jgi:monovalent cation:H+ antiporter-2, CPA2 family